jgi:Family of unknown function (DUF5709)
VSQRDYEEQPESPVLGEVVQEPVGETLVGPSTSDVLDAGYVPPDRPYVTDNPATLARDQDLDQRLREERPDIDADAAASAADVEPDRAPRLAATETTPDTRYTEDLEAEGVGVDGGAASAEEAAVHLRDEDDRPLYPDSSADPSRDR